MSGRLHPSPARQRVGQVLDGIAPHTIGLQARHRPRTHDPMDERTHYRTCPLCEATCGLTITTRGREVTGIRGDDDDVLSHGYICPKGPALAALDSDPDRLRRPMIRRGSTRHEVGWD